MKINIIGGGPAGMYFAILMKNAGATHDITIYERNGSDDTFGWGVVFSGKTLANLRAAVKNSAWLLNSGTKLQISIRSKQIAICWWPRTVSTASSDKLLKISSGPISACARTNISGTARSNCFMA